MFWDAFNKKLFRLPKKFLEEFESLKQQVQLLINNFKDGGFI